MVPPPKAKAGDGLRSGKLHDRVATSIGVEIATGVIPAGSLLPTEMEAAERFKVSRTAYREAIRALAGKGLVSSRPKTGTRVNPRRDWALLDPELLGWMFAKTPTPASIRSLFELRRIVEPSAAALAAEKRTAEQLSAMGHALEEMAEHGLDKAEGQQADGRFHALILEATGNEFLLALTDSISTAIRWTTILKFAASKAPRNPMMLHRDLFSAIADRDPDRARTVTLTLLAQAQEDTETSIQPDGEA
ncbi:FadR family transcriptional regulator [Sphingobium sufflavum]|uniref:FadR/GntR family transcriptional regulator n=1 Tax=Sphingobium sufflavum TaxID=1129547 RepID=UPI001F457606|nr:FadR/GntR family transcriptional regulator [Sphingobium sufflavum]MCE7797075.1 FadR family transcriptional regulator [Sphingobium sufflavum]